MKMFEFIEAKIGRWAIAVGAVVLVALLLVLHFACHQRQPGSPRGSIAGLPLVAGMPGPMVPTSPPPAAVAQATTATSTHVHIVIRHWPRQWIAPGAGGGKPAQVGESPAPGGTASGSTAAAIGADSSPIEIDVTTSSTARSTAATTASAPSQVAAAMPTQLPVPNHGRIGVLAATVPGVLAVDVEAFQLRTPWWLVGQPIEVGLDAEANLAEVGGGISLGSKAFLEAGGYTTYHGDQLGLYLGGGLRF
ncbi:MAG: hypothetical protein KGR26_03500 [Cyanobacteria bacterium REEB65]|nr:hypothetical protein [Cyanobacteria bacterium REEB65]